MAGQAPFLAIAIPGFAGVALVVNGVFILAGSGWAYIAAGAAFVGFAAIIRRGIYRVG